MLQGQQDQSNLHDADYQSVVIDFALLDCSLTVPCPDFVQANLFY